jgi:acyl-CoA thioester hydrolase
MQIPPEGFRHHTRIEVRFGDMDAMGHVNNAMYQTYIETARVRYMEALGLWQDRETAQIGPIVARIAIDFKLPVHMRDGVVDIYSRGVRLGTKSYEMEHILLRTRDGVTAVAALAQSVLVAYDYAANTSVVIPDHWRHTITDYDGLRG